MCQFGNSHQEDYDDYYDYDDTDDAYTNVNPKPVHGKPSHSVLDLVNPTHGVAQQPQIVHVIHTHIHKGRGKNGRKGGGNRKQKRKNRRRIRKNRRRQRQEKHGIHYH